MEKVLSNVLVVLLKHISVRSLLDDEIQSACMKVKQLENMFLPYMSNYSDTELRHILASMDEDLRKYIEWDGIIHKDMNLFDAIFRFAEKVLTTQDNEVVCKYTKLLRWRRVTSQISEETFVMAFMAKRDASCGVDCKNFSHKPVIGHNNMQLKAILNSGYSENHFHLMGSAPYFQLSWIQLMNQSADSAAIKQLRAFEERRRSVNVSYDKRYVEESFETMIRQAFLIRLYLCSKFMGVKIKLGRYQVSSDFLRSRRKDGKEWIKQYLEDKETVDLEWCREWIEPDVYDALWEEKTLECVVSLLQDECSLMLASETMQYEIHAIKSLNGFQEGDYALSISDYEWYANHGRYVDLWGERSFLYRCFREICKKGRLFSYYESNLFHAYLVIKETIRGEMVQANEYVGFENFQIHQDRKESFSAGLNFEKSMARMAVRDTLQSQNILRLEARISPAASAKENYRKITFYDNAVDEKEEFRDRYYYVLHFIKSREDGTESIWKEEERHSKKRRDIQKRAYALKNFREKYPSAASRVLGIDAASQEIGCRPEVFATAFRFLKSHTCSYGTSREKKLLPQLRISYHVGEDFLDVADGLRAIEEAVLFLGMDCGDRLGHALALGIDVQEWYASKKYRIVIPAQDYLDNIVWIYYAVIRYRIKDADNLKDFLEQEFSYAFHKIYGDSIIRKSMHRIISRVNERYKNEKDPDSAYDLYYEEYAFSAFDIHNYYRAWQLRGDAPELYKKGFFDRKSQLDFFGNPYIANSFCPEEFSVRYVPEAAYLYYLYHYSWDVKLKGRKEMEFKISPMLIKGIDAIQKELQKEIAKRGISIESNPSSNYMIGTFKKYAKHPIIRFYNRGLVSDAEKIEECPQIWSSINTDDQGVFSASLENEYALMALALEKEHDGKGRSIYNKTMIYEWIDNIRINGNRQAFGVMQGKTFQE